MGTKKRNEEDRRRREDAEDIAAFQARASEPTLDLEVVLEELERRESSAR